jgi:RNA polymerase sigma factor (TIGR02999 family)
VRAGDRDALGRLFSLAYNELRDAARVQRRRQPASDSLTTTALVHEAFIKLFGSETRDFTDRAHFMAVAATAMRQILIGHARRKHASKRAGGMVSFEEAEYALEGQLGTGTPNTDVLLALDGALQRLTELSPRQSRVVECRFFGGMSIEETAAALGISSATVKRDWSMAQAWLYRTIQGELR